MDPKSQLIVRAAGICSIFLAVGGLLRLGGTGWWLIGALALLGLGMILAGLPEILFGWNRFGRKESRPFRAGVTTGKMTGMKRNGPGKIPGEIMAWLAAIAFLVTMGFGLLLVSQIQASQRQSDEMKTLDAAIAALQQQRPPGGAPGGSFVQLNPELEKAMLKYFDDSSTRANGVSLFGAIPWITVLLVAIAAIVLALAAKEHPSAAPVLGVIPLAIAVIEHAEKLSRLDAGSFWVVFAVFIAIAFTLIWWGRDGDSADVSARGEKKKVDSLPVMGFSLLVLLFVLVYLGYRQQPEQKGSCPICVTPGPPPTPAMSKLQIDPIDQTPLFDPGLHEHFRGSEEQLKQILKNTREGDTLLLLGSADCTSYTGENAKLAQDRANTIKKALESDANKGKVDIEARALKQHDSCKAADQLRAVFPVLIRPVSAGVESKNP
ncbi:MAG TPA: hypothetical protein VNY74_07545 [Edaphobacter sp.]|nr:hypothetical protein [Edaphobacter sp.]